MKPLTDDFPKIKLDQSASTRAELLKDWPLSVRAFDAFARRQVNNGFWKRVLKRYRNRVFTAYRRVR